MAIALPTKPEVVVHGIIVKSAQKFKYDEDTKKPSDEFLRWELTVASDSGNFKVGVYPEYAADMPAVGDTATVWTAIGESQYGATLTYVRRVTPDDLDRLARTFEQIKSK